MKKYVKHLAVLWQLEPEFLDWLDNFSEKNNIKFTITISADIAEATDGIKKYF